MCKVKTRHLLAVNGLLWTAIGIKITITGVSHYLQVTRAESLLWMIPLSLAVFAAFYVMFTGVVRKYSARILAMPEQKAGIWRTFIPCTGLLPAGTKIGSNQWHFLQFTAQKM